MGPRRQIPIVLKMISDTLVSSCHADVHVHFFSLNLIYFHLKLEKEREMS